MTKNNSSETVKKVPQRMCVVCKEMRDKKSLMRIVRTPEGEYKLDYTGKLNGRGAYICADKDCVEKCLKKRLLNKAFKTNVEQSVYDALAEEYAAK